MDHSSAGNEMRQMPQPCCRSGLPLLRFCQAFSCGEVSERLKEPASKAGRPGTVSWVRIPPSPPSLLVVDTSSFEFVMSVLGKREFSRQKDVCTHVLTSANQADIVLVLRPGYAI